MELVEGGSFDERWNKRRVRRSTMLNMALDLADALTRAHRLNIVHRDIKPANVLLAQDGMPRLTDFGIARVTGSDITETGSILGTIAYIAPEVLQGKSRRRPLGHLVAGMMLFEMLAGTLHINADSPGGLIHAIVGTPMPDLEALRPDVPPALIDLVNRMVMKDPDERVPRMRLVGSEIEAILPPSRPRRTDTDQAVAVNQRSSRPAASRPRRYRRPKRGATICPPRRTPFVGRETNWPSCSSCCATARCAC